MKTGGSKLVVNDNNASSDYDIALALDSYNHPQISYYDFHYGYMKYATSSDGITWDVQTVDEAGETSRLGWYNSIAVGSDNKPQISYYDYTYYYTGSNHYLKYANYYSGAWHPVNVVTSGYNGQYNSIAVDSNNNPHISYFDGDNRRLKYISYNGSTWNSPVTVDSCEIGWPTSLALDGDNHPHICYWDSVNARLKYASYNTVSGWTTGFVAPTNTVGAGSLALDSNGVPHISCNDRTTGSLKYAGLNGTAWDIETVDNGVSVGYDTSLAIDDDNNPHICYWDSTSHALKYASYTPTPPVLTGKIAFTSSRDSNLEIYVMNADGSNQTRLTNNPTADEYPAWSPDGNKIAFDSNRDGNREIYVMNIDGSGQTRLTNNTTWDHYPAWSPDGARIAFRSERDGNGEIYVMNAADGSGVTRLTNNSADDTYPEWSPDGAKIAFASNRLGESEIYVMNSADGSDQTNISNSSWSDIYPAWSPDGARIAYYATRDAKLEIYAMNAVDGSNQTQLTNNSWGDAYPAWSPDSAMITFQSDRDVNREIYIMNADGSGQVNISNNAADDRYPAWSAGPTVITLTAEPSSIVSDGISTSTLTATVKDHDGNPVADDTNVVFTTSKGTVGSSTTVDNQTIGGIATATLTSENSTQIVVADVSATVNGISKTIAVFFTPPSSPPITDNNTETVIGNGVIADSSTGGSVTVDATGSHTITTTQYGGNPGGDLSFESSGNYFDVHVDNTLNLNSMTIQFSPATESTVIYYWNGSDWLPASNQTYAGSIVTVTVTSSTYPSLADLSGLFFGSGTPLETEPTVINTPATSIMATTAILHGNLTSDGGAATTVIIYGGTIDGETPPSRPGNWTQTNNIGVRPEGAFSLGITGLSPNTKYYYRCYVTSTGGSSWATSSSSFTTQQPLGLWRNYWAGPGKDWHWFSSGRP